MKWNVPAGYKSEYYRGKISDADGVCIDRFRDIRAEVYRKGNDGVWVLASEAGDLEESIEIGHIRLTLQMSGIYAQTEDLR